MRPYALLLIAALPVQAIAASPPPPCNPMVIPAPQFDRISSRFGERGREFHAGLDLAAPYGSPVLAAAAGSVIYAGRYYGYGKMIDVRGRGDVVTRYAHLSSIDRGIKPGQHVTAGEVLGAIGTTGEAHGPHLHFEVRVDGRPENPSPFLAPRCSDNPAKAPVEVAQAPDTPSPHVRHHHAPIRAHRPAH